MLSEREIRILHREHKLILDSDTLKSELAREFYKTRFELLGFILEGEMVPEPPTNNSTLNDYDQVYMKKTRD